ncbi:MAG: outer membrane protein TolC [Halioglobus sp.]|jgi:outer membrane protein TolC
MKKLDVSSIMKRLPLLALLCLTSYANAWGESVASPSSVTLGLDEVVRTAQRNDPWLVGNKHEQVSIESLSLASGTLPDPKVSVGLVNLATDSFDFNQEPMTHFRVGVSQSFPRGDSLGIRRKQLDLTSRQYPYQREDRKGRVTVAASTLWLDAYKAQQSIALINNDRSLFEELVDVAQMRYSSAVGGVRQQDIIRAQLELTALEDRLMVLHQQRETNLQKLSEWLSDYFVEEYSDNSGVESLLRSSTLLLNSRLPKVEMLNRELYLSNVSSSPQLLFENMSAHPAVTAVERKIDASAAGVELAQQKYKPEWGVNAAYGYRDDDPLGNTRADFFSVGVTFDVPLFTRNRQDKEYQSAVSQTASTRSQKWQLVRHLIASFEATKAQFRRLNERQALYEEQLLPQMHDQAEASLSAYTNDAGDFSEVVRARIAELNARIDALSIDVDRQKAIIQMNYFFMTSANQIVVSSYTLGDRQ